MIEVEGIGKNVEKAIEDALLKLKASRDHVDIKILETGGLFKKAKVMVSISEEYLGTYKKHKENKKKFLAEEKPEVSVMAVKPEIKEIKEVKKAEQNKKVVEAPKQKEEPKEEVQKQNIEPKRERKQEANQDINEAENGKEFLEKFIGLANLNAVVDMYEDEDEIFYTIIGEDAHHLIGYRGESLNSLQFLVSVLNGKANRRNKRVRLDIDGYREKRKGTLELLAARVAKKVQKTGKQMRLEPMTAYERRIIHTVVQDFEGVSSVSRGDEPHRYLIIRKDRKEGVVNQPEVDDATENNEEN